jgi:hypothetical protein
VEFLDPIIDFLGERRGLLQKYNWQIAFGIVASILAALTAKERAKKWRKLKDDHRETMLEKPIQATVFSTEEEGEVRYSAFISSCTGGFRATVERDGDRGAQVVLDEVVPSLDEMEVFLRENSRFILTDFQ